MPASHHSVFYRPDALPAAQPTVSNDKLKCKPQVAENHNRELQRKFNYSLKLLHYFYAKQLLHMSCHWMHFKTLLDALLVHQLSVWVLLIPAM